MASISTAFRVKITQIFLPFLLLSVGLLVLYTSFNWLVFIKLELIQANGFITNFVLPACLSGLAVIFWYRHRIKLLHLKRKSGDLPTLYVLVAILAMTVPTVIAQEYLVTATGKLTQLDSITQIGKLPATKYYTLKEYYIDKKSAGIFQETTTSGKRDRNLVFTYYITCPIRVARKTDIDSASLSANPLDPLYVLDGEIIPAPIQEAASAQTYSVGGLTQDEIASITVLKDTAAQRLYGDRGRNGVVLISSTPRGWLALEYSKTISNSLSPEEKDQAFEEFAQESKANFEQRDLAQFEFMERMTPAHSDLEAFQISIQKSPGFQHTGLGPLLIPHQVPFAQRNGQKLPWIFYSLAIGAGVWLLMISIVRLSNIKRRKKRTRGLWSRRLLKRALAGLLPADGFLITPIIMYLNVLVFAVLVMAGLGFMYFNAGDLHTVGGNFRPSVLQEGEYWRLMTNVFLHGGIMHLLMNMFALLCIGVILEPLLGRAKYTLVYLICGVTASLASIWWYEATVSVGASGAIFGLYGFYVALLTTNLFPPEVRKSFLKSVMIFIGFNLALGLVGGVDNAAHVGGLLTGFILGYGYYFLNRDTLLQEEEEMEITAEEQVHA
ncbi:rhomboid family intramembrane serine protease [Nibribacter koreensis]|uniref:Peptidase S54 rhomboid domain-containing protein n=1 Tax=Nibribacter koreensis TaxID=1084519 RepID=A0ABP8FLQ1_9BACT